MKKIISLLLITLSMASTSVLANSKTCSGKHMNFSDRAITEGQYSGKYLLRQGQKIPLEAIEKDAPKAYWSGKYVIRQGVKTAVNPVTKTIHKANFSGKYYFRKGERFLVKEKKRNS